jgi:hypothetical protein
MFTTYAVKIEEGVKHRFVVGMYETEDEARHMANCATCGNANYAYVKDSTGGTLFYLETPADAYLVRDLESVTMRAPRPPSLDQD